MSSIFVQIASYRDKELLPTLRDIVAKTSSQNQLTFGIMWQKDETETIEEFASDKRVRIIDCDWKQSKGLGWARSLIQTLYQDEDYTIQLDSHHRFAQDWDVTLIDMLEGLKKESNKPLLTSYAYGYDPNNDKILTDLPCRILFHDFKSSGTIWLNPNPIPNHKSLNGPIRARFISGHYFFTDGSHTKEYAYDPDLYFAGDEITLTTRSYTMGYDLYHPHRNVVWHHYGRTDRVKHWTDHTEQNQSSGLVETTWRSRDEYSKQRIRQLLGQDDYGIDLGRFGLGNSRPLNDYEKYAGIDFKNRRIQKSAIAGIEPPVLFADEKEWNDGFLKKTPVRINNFNKEEFLKKIDDISFFKLEFLSLQRKIIHNEMISKDSILKNDSIFTTVIADNVPMKFVLAGMSTNLDVVHMVSGDMRSHVHWN